MSENNETNLRESNMTIVDRKKFAIIWQKSGSMQDVIAGVEKHLGRQWDAGKCTNVAARIRKEYFPDLKRLQRGGAGGQRIDKKAVAEELKALMGKVTHARNAKLDLEDLLAKAE